MRDIRSHHDGHGLNELLRILATDTDESGASHRYTVKVGFEEDPVARMQFQQGPRGAALSTSGITENVLLAILIDRLEGFQRGPMNCAENVDALAHLKGAMGAMKARAHERAKRGVLGKFQP